MLQSPILLAFLLALANIYFLANWKVSLLVKFFASISLAIVAGVIGAIAFTPNSLELKVLLITGFLNFIFTVGLYPLLAQKFLKKRKQEELDEQKDWINKNFKKKK